MNDTLRKLAKDLEEAGEHEEAHDLHKLVKEEPAKELHTISVTLSGATEEELLESLHNTLTEIADKLDDGGKVKEADLVDGMIGKLASWLLDGTDWSHVNDGGRAETTYDSFGPLTMQLTALLYDGLIPSSSAKDVEGVIDGIERIARAMRRHLDPKPPPLPNKQDTKHAGLMVIPDTLDALGLAKEADLVDGLLVKLAAIRKIASDNPVVQLIEFVKSLKDEDRAQLLKISGIDASEVDTLLNPSRMGADIGVRSLANLFSHLLHMTSYLADMKLDIADGEQLSGKRKSIYDAAEESGFDATKVFRALHAASINGIQSHNDMLKLMAPFGTKRVDLHVGVSGESNDYAPEFGSTNESVKEAAAKDLYDSKKNNEETFKHNKPKKQTEIKHHNPAFQETKEKGLSSRYCKDHIGVMLSRVGDRQYECPLDGARFNYDDMGSVANQTPSSSNVAIPSRLFDPSEDVVNKVH
jgi:hypothetical protein